MNFNQLFVFVFVRLRQLSLWWLLALVFIILESDHPGGGYRLFSGSWVIYSDFLLFAFFAFIFLVNKLFIFELKKENKMSMLASNCVATYMYISNEKLVPAQCMAWNSLCFLERFQSKLPRIHKKSLEWRRLFWFHSGRWGRKTI